MALSLVLADDVLVELGHDLGRGEEILIEHKRMGKAETKTCHPELAKDLVTVKQLQLLLIVLM